MVLTLAGRYVADPVFGAAVLVLGGCCLLTIEMLVREVYTLGRFLAERKYRYLRLAYLAFIAGLAASAALVAAARFG